MSRLGALAAALCLGLLFASSAAGAYEETGVFAGILEPPAEAGKFPEEMQLGNTGGVAVNYTGAGGVPKGTLYATTVTSDGGIQVARYEPSGESMSFVESWEVNIFGGLYKRCGPLLGTSCPAQPGAGNHYSVDVDVDQSTGNVYALLQTGLAGTKMIVEYSPDGAKEITRFGEKAESEKTTAETPSQIHASNSGGIAVNGAGEVYVFDLNNPNSFYHRLMVFKPQTPGDYEHYVYAGEFAAGFLPDGREPRMPVTDAAGHIYVAGEGYVDEFAAESPSAYPGPHSAPICHFEYTKEGITSIAVNPTSGEVFFFSSKKDTGASGLKVKLVHQLGPCNEATHKFEAGGKEEIDKFEVRPERAELYGMAYDPVRKLSAGRAAGVLYGAAPGGETDLGTGSEVALRSLGYIFAPTTGAAKFKLTVTKSGTGKGSVTSTPVGVFCGTTFCLAEFESGKEVELKKTPEAGSEFVKWGGACSGTGTCKVTMSEAKAVTAEFGPGKPKFKLSVTKSGTGSGKVTSTPAGISCDPTCSFEFEEGKEVELKQEASAGSEFVKWSGACSGSGSCKVMMSVAKEVSAEFKLLPVLPKFKLSVTKPGTGTGKVTSTPAGISCDPTCSIEFEEGKEVELKQEAGPGSEFKEWTGACTGSGTCKVTMSEAKSVSAVFESKPAAEYTLTVTVTGEGEVSADSGTISGCTAAAGPSCKGTYTEGTKVTLTETPGAGQQFNGWGTPQCDESTATTCLVEVKGNEGVTASFAASKPKFKLSVSKSGTGAGKVTSTPAGISCDPTCSFEFEEGKEVELKQEASAGSEFVKWAGACSGSGTCKVTMSAAKEVGAEFKLIPKPKFKLTVTKTGTGQGTVSGGSTAEPSTIACGSGTGCEHEYEEGALITLSQSPTVGSEFKGWTGCSSEESGKCKVTMSAAKEVKAKFDLIPTPKFKLSVTKTGTGKVTSTPAGISCDPTCSAEFESGKVVELKEAPEAGSGFVKWTGACSGSGTCKVTMSEAKAVGAEFKLLPRFKLSVTKSGSGQGTVTSTPAGIECGETCKAEFEAGREVELKAEATAGSEFVKWSGACTGSGACTVTMSSAKSVYAAFRPIPTYKLQVIKSGSGGGRVTSSAPITDIDCGFACQAKFQVGTEVELTATPDPGSEFFKWSGACTGTGSCKVTMSAGKSVHATFKEIPRFMLSVTKTGSGTVASSPAGIECGAQCTHEYTSGTALTLTATPARGYRFTGFTGCDSATGASCTVAMNSARTVSASFVLAKCRKGFHRKKVNGKPRCVRVRRHASHRRRGQSARASAGPLGWSF